MSVFFLFTFDIIPASYLLIYHCAFLLLSASATGGLFVAATWRYYTVGNNQNRGIGYAWELLGSAVGALLTTTVLLPVIGLYWLMISIIILLAVIILGCLIKRQ